MSEWFQNFNGKTIISWGGGDFLCHNLIKWTKKKGPVLETNAVLFVLRGVLIFIITHEYGKEMMFEFSS